MNILLLQLQNHMVKNIEKFRYIYNDYRYIFNSKIKTYSFNMISEELVSLLRNINAFGSLYNVRSTSLWGPNYNDMDTMLLSVIQLKILINYIDDMYSNSGIKDFDKVLTKAFYDDSYRIVIDFARSL
jgi:hypothetical protein